MSTSLETDIGITEAIFHRRAVRHYSTRSVEPEVVVKLLAAAVQAPSAMNQQPWVFAVFHGRKQLMKYSEMAKQYLIATYPRTFELNSRAALYEDPDYDIFHGANTLIVIYATKGRLHPNEDCCLAAENLMLAAYGISLGTCPIGFARPWLDELTTKRELGVPEHYTAIFPVVVGYPDGTPQPTRRNEPEIVTWKWDRDEEQSSQASGR